MTLADWRRRIDEIDSKLVELLNARSRCALEIGKLKQAANLPLYQPEREKEVLQNAERSNPGPLSNAATIVFRDTRSCTDSDRLDGRRSPRGMCPATISARIRSNT